MDKLVTNGVGEGLAGYPEDSYPTIIDRVQERFWDKYSKDSEYGRLWDRICGARMYYDQDIEGLVWEMIGLTVEVVKEDRD
jgi:hypothetical protein